MIIEEQQSQSHKQEPINVNVNDGNGYFLRDSEGSWFFYQCEVKEVKGKE